MRTGGVLSIDFCAIYPGGRIRSLQARGSSSTAATPKVTEPFSPHERSHLEHRIDGGRKLQQTFQLLLATVWLLRAITSIVLTSLHPFEVLRRWRRSYYHKS